MTAPPYFHGGVRGLDVGDFLLPPAETKAPSASDFGGARVHDRHCVYVTTSIDAAFMFGALHPSGGAVYEVVPVGGLMNDPDCDQPGLSYTCPRARVTRVVRRKITAKERRMVLRAVL